MKPHKEYRINNSTIKIVFGNILDSQSEVIVNSCGSKMSMGGGISKAIRETGGEIIREDAQRKLPVNLGDAIVTTAGNLRQKYLFHCITIDKTLDHSNTPEQVSEEDIHQYIVGHSIDKSFQLLHVMELSSIAFPSIGAGGAGIPFNKVAKVMAETISRNLRKTNKSLCVEIYLYDRYKMMDTWDFLPMFEQFSAQEMLSRLLREQVTDSLTVESAPPIKNEKDATLAFDKEVFISYSRKDSDVVKLLYERLEKSGVKCWLDIDGMYSGVSFKKVIVDAIKQAKLVMFMSSENSNKSRNVVSEVSVAVEHNKKILPIKLDVSPYAESIEYDLVNHDYVIYDHNHIEVSYENILRKVVSTLNM